MSFSLFFSLSGVSFQLIEIRQQSTFSGVKFFENILCEVRNKECKRLQDRLRDGVKVVSNAKDKVVPSSLPKDLDQSIRNLSANKMTNECHRAVHVAFNDWISFLNSFVKDGNSGLLSQMVVDPTDPNFGYFPHDLTISEANASTGPGRTDGPTPERTPQPPIFVCTTG